MSNTFSTVNRSTQHSAEPLRIGYVLKRFPRFSETFIVNEILELERQNIDVTVFSLLHPPKEKRHEILDQIKAKVIYLPRQRATDGWNIDQTQSKLDDVVRSNIATFDTPPPFPDLFPEKSTDEIARLMLQATSVAMLASHLDLAHLHAHFASNATSVAMLASRLTGIPFSFTAHARDIYHHYVNPEVDDRLRATKILASSFVATVSDYNRKHLQNLVPEYKHPMVRRLYNGIDLQHFLPGRDRDTEKVFVGIGRLVEKKGFSDLVSACHILKTKGHDFQCVIVGDGPLKNELSNQIAELGLEDVISLPGSLTQDRVRDLLNQAIAMVLPCVITASGDRDGLPTVLLEAMAMEVATISTSVAGVPEIIDSGETGFIVQPNDTNALATAMIKLLNNPAQARQMGMNGRERAGQLFNREHNVAQLAHWFRESTLDSGKQMHVPSTELHRGGSS